MQFENGPFNSETTETGNILSNEIAEAQPKKWQNLIEVNRFYTQNQKNVENHQQTVEGLHATSTAMQGDR